MQAKVESIKCKVGKSARDEMGTGRRWGGYYQCGVCSVHVQRIRIYYICIKWNSL